MIYLYSFITGLLLGLCVIRMHDYMSKRIYDLRVKEVKEELTHSKLGTEPPGTAKSLQSALVQSERLPV